LNRYVGNLPPTPGVFPDYPAQVIRNAAGERELAMMRWGVPPPPRAGGYPVANISNITSPRWCSPLTGSGPNSGARLRRISALDRYQPERESGSALLLQRPARMRQPVRLLLDRRG
jgi:hypothetical protein